MAESIPKGTHPKVAAWAKARGASDPHGEADAYEREFPTPPPETDVEALGATVREGIDPNDAVSLTALTALLQHIETLTRERDHYRTFAHDADGHLYVERLWLAEQRAEAQIETLTRERDEWKGAAEFQPSSWSDIWGKGRERAEAAEAKLAEARVDANTFAETAQWHADKRREAEAKLVEAEKGLERIAEEHSEMLLAGAIARAALRSLRGEGE